jgi:hypothetical protein
MNPSKAQAPRWRRRSCDQGGEQARQQRAHEAAVEAALECPRRSKLDPGMGAGELKAGCG